MTVARLKRHCSTLKRLAKSKPSVTKPIIKGASKDLINTLSECSYNVLQGVVPLSTKQQQKLRRYKTKLRECANKRVSQKRKKAILMRGGFLGTLLNPIISILGQILTG